MIPRPSLLTFLDVINVQIGANRCLVLHKTEIPIRDVVAIKPFDCLIYRLLMKVLDV